MYIVYDEEINAKKIEMNKMKLLKRKNEMKMKK